jgi:hypothetical protein
MGGSFIDILGRFQGTQRHLLAAYLANKNDHFINGHFVNGQLLKRHFNSGYFIYGNFIHRHFVKRHFINGHFINGHFKNGHWDISILEISLQAILRMDSSSKDISPTVISLTEILKKKHFRSRCLINKVEWAPLNFINVLMGLNLSPCEQSK